MNNHVKKKFGPHRGDGAVRPQCRDCNIRKAAGIRKVKMGRARSPITQRPRPSVKVVTPGVCKAILTPSGHLSYAPTCVRPPLLVARSFGKRACVKGAVGETARTFSVAVTGPTVASTSSCLLGFLGNASFPALRCYKQVSVAFGSSRRLGRELAGGKSVRCMCAVVRGGIVLPEGAYGHHH